MNQKRADYDDEIRKDDINFWKTTNDDDGRNEKTYSKIHGDRAYGPLGGPREEQGELQADSSFQPIKRENVYNLWLNNAEELEFYKPQRNPPKVGSPVKEVGKAGPPLPSPGPMKLKKPTR